MHRTPCLSVDALGDPVPCHRQLQAWAAAGGSRHPRAGDIVKGIRARRRAISVTTQSRCITCAVNDIRHVQALVCSRLNDR